MPTTVTMASGPTSPTTRPGARNRRASRRSAVITSRLSPPWRVGCQSVWNDYHLIYAVALIVLAAAAAGDTLGAGRLWAKLPFVRDHSRLR
ncbi:hypothetical protein ABZ725_48155 [Streptomyces sp. NPDC006872]|uniref:hypothetical protein n=1 Tax=Streptomyces sp. NPDC006872 TaxID=3155720 RepID=UPI0033CD473C